MTTTVFKWRVYCVTDDTYEEVWSETEPTTCPTNTAHTIGAVTEVTTVDVTGVVKVQEEEIPTGGHFQAKTLALTTNPNSSNYVEVSWPYPISVLSIEWVSEEVHRGDTLDMTVGKDTITGFLAVALTPNAEWTSQNYNLNDMVRYNNKDYKCILSTVSNEDPTDTTYWEYQPLVITVSPTVIQYAEIGFHINLFNGLQSDDLGRVISKDTNASTLTMELTTSNSYAVTQPLPTYIRQTVYMLNGFEMSAPWESVIGESKIGGSYLPTHTKVRVTYHNMSTSGDPKKIVGRVEYMY